MAQDAPTVEIFGGYTYIHFNAGSGTIGTFSPGGAGFASRGGVLQIAGPGAITTLTSNINGGSASLAYNLNHWFGLAADFGGSAITKANFSGQPSVNVSSTLFTYLFGPRISYREKKTFTPFVQVLLGGAYITDITSGGATVAKSQNAFAMTVGGGLDLNVSKYIALRLGQAEYLLTRFNNPFALSGAPVNQNNFRFSAGVVLRLGGGSK
jgi:opacity protein-like surface antigen